MISGLIAGNIAGAQSIKGPPSPVFPVINLAGQDSSPVGSISGTVLRANGAAPVSGASVFALDFNTPSLRGSGSTDAAGAYTVTGLPPGNYQVEVDATDQGLVRECYHGGLLCRSPTPVRVAPGQNTPEIDFTLAAGGVIAGTVRMADGITPVANALVTASGFNYGWSADSSVTASDGSYTLKGIPSGDFRVEVDATHLGLLREHYPNGSIPTYGQAPVTVKAPAHTLGIDFTLEVGGTISGTVLEPDGVTPVTGASVRAFNRYYGNETTTAADGSYTIQGLTPAVGAYEVRVDASDQGLMDECYQDAVQCQNPTRVAVTLGADIPNIDFTLEVGGTISGTVLGPDGVTPVAGASVTAIDFDTRGGRATATAADGGYAIRGLPAGEYEVRVDTLDQGYLRECYPDDVQCRNPTPVGVTLGADTPNIDFILVVGGTISGTVLEPDGVTPVAYASVDASGIDFGDSTATAADGSYTFRGLPTGDYRVQASAPDQGLLEECFRAKPLCRNPTAVAVTLGADTPNIDFTLEAGGTISGTVLKPDGVTPVANAAVYASGINIGFGDSTATAADGSYAFRGLRTGNYRLWASARDQGLQGLLDECYGTKPLSCQNPTPVAVTLGADTPNIDFTLKSSRLLSEATLSLHQDPADGATGLKVAISRAIDPNTGSERRVLLRVFQSRLDYPDATANSVFPAGTTCINILDVREIDFPITGRDIDNLLARTAFNGVDLAGVPWPADLGHALTRLNGSASQQCTVDLEITSITRTGGKHEKVPPRLTRLVQRGDARADGVVNIADALFIAQYLAGSRPACTAIVDTACLHSVNAASVRQDGNADRITIADAQFITQYLAGLRDEYYNLVPPAKR
jgi:hypothetical protein